MDQKILNKIKTPKALSKVVSKLKEKGKVVVHCHGVYDLVHLGHIRHFGLAKAEGDVLVVSITRDKFVRKGPGRPIFNEHLRAETLASLAMVDYVSIVDHPTAVEFIKTVKPSVYVKGSEYRAKDKDVTGKIYDEEDAVTSVGGRLAFTDDITFSSSKIINNVLDVFPPRTQKYLKAIGKRYPIEKIQSAIDGLKDLKVLVIGDAIVDEYHYCQPMGKSSKGEVLVNRYHSEESFAGGALATANNVASVCERVDLLTVLGKDNTYQSFIEDHLSPNIRPIFIERSLSSTTVKRRYVSKGTNRKLFEICYMEDCFIQKREESKVLTQLKKKIGQYDVVIVSDFGHGLMTPRIIDFICEKAKYLAINVQTNGANAGFNIVTKYPRANCVCVDEMELRFAAQDKFGDVRGLSKQIYQEIGCDHIIATRGPYGSLCYSKEHGYHETPAFSNNVVDAIGAGDAFFAFVAPCFVAGMPPELVSFIGNAVGSLAVQIVCNRQPVDSVNLIKFIMRLLK
ncbi:MAG: adenylyltransferase/cytidyltransferase family protein [Candidatus Omnitrophica bacterium]|nr:adenylyltransferase/cytidyltransferase family protein [Candidatus Omnitrophota bacterium]